MTLPLQVPASLASQDNIRYITGASSLGGVLLAVNPQGLCALLFGDSPEELRADLARRFPRTVLRHDASLTPELEQALGHLENPRQPLDLPLAPRGSAFEQRVWQVLRQIPVGQTMTYSAIARQLDQPRAFRAVANACAANALAVVIPCHRAIRLDGGLSGYRWGVERKRALLEREANP